VQARKISPRSIVNSKTEVLNIDPDYQPDIGVQIVGELRSKLVKRFSLLSPSFFVSSVFSSKYATVAKE